jgi:hypothetical protein
MFRWQVGEIATEREGQASSRGGSLRRILAHQPVADQGRGESPFLFAERTDLKACGEILDIDGVQKEGGSEEQDPPYV